MMDLSYQLLMSLSILAVRHCTLHSKNWLERYEYLTPDQKCPNCEGYGFHTTLHKRCPCHTCSGRGYVSEQFLAEDKMYSMTKDLKLRVKKL